MNTPKIQVENAGKTFLDPTPRQGETPGPLATRNKEEWWGDTPYTLGRTPER